jgi:hypothetical protein
MSMRNMRNIIVLAFVALTLKPAGADILALTQPIDQKVVAQVLNHAGQGQIREATAFQKQSFRLSQNGAFVGTLVSGRGYAQTSEKREDGSPIERLICFLALARTGGAVDLVRTIGNGEWEAEACTSVEAVGIVTDAPGSAHKIAIVYDAHVFPRSQLPEVVIFSWDGGAQRIEIDEATSRQASGATTIRDIRRLLSAR